MIEVGLSEEPMTASPRRTSRRRRPARVLVVANALIVLIILAGWVPGPVGTAVSVMLPILGGIAVVLTLATFLVTRRAAIPAAVAVLVWLVAMGPALPALPAAASEASMTIASQNVRAQSGSGEQSAQELMEGDPDVITLTELDSDSREAANRVLSASYPHSYAVGTVGVWSRYPLVEGEPLDLGLGWNRALRVTVQGPAGDTNVYLVHAASLRIGAQTARDGMLAALASTVREDPSPRIIALGDFNAATTDPALRDLGAELDIAHQTDGLTGFSWPARFPLVKIDHVFQRGFDVASASTRRAGTSDHLATITTLSAR